MLTDNLKLQDLWLRLTAQPVHLSRSTDYPDRYVYTFEVEVLDGEGDKVAVLECLLVDVVAASRDDRCDLHDDLDAQDSELEEIAAFALNSSGLVRGRLLNLIAPQDDKSEDDDDGDCANLLCVNGGTWTGNPEALAFVIRRLGEILNFAYVLVDTACLRCGLVGADWRSESPPNDPLVLKEPFVKVVWGEFAPDDGPTDPRRFFWFGRLPEYEAPDPADDTPTGLRAPARA